MPTQTIIAFTLLFAAFIMAIQNVRQLNKLLDKSRGVALDAIDASKKSHRISRESQRIIKTQDNLISNLTTENVRLRSQIRDLQQDANKRPAHTNEIPE